METYHVLSNSNIIMICFYTVFFAIVLAAFFSGFAMRDASPAYKKGTIGKIVPWILLLLFLSDVVWIISQLSAYPWDMEPQPSNASIYREIRYQGSGYPIFGWANDYQLPIVGKFGGCVATLCWAAYAFAYKRSDTNWWKKACKVIAYALLSVLIMGFSLHGFQDLLLGVLLYVLPAIILLLLAHVKPAVKSSLNSSESTHDKWA